MEGIPIVNYEALTNAVKFLLSPHSFLLIFAGVFYGLIFGAIPGLTAMMAIVTLIPITFYMQPESAMTLLISTYMGGMSGGLVSAILLNIPGTPSSIATTFDGWPMAKSGMAKKALGHAVVASFTGSLVGAIVLTFTAPALARLILHFGSWEYFTLGLLALTVMVSLSGKSLLKSLLSGVLGLFIASVGVDPVTGMKRLTFGWEELSNGFALLPTLLGLFAIPEVMEALLSKQEKYVAPPIPKEQRFFPRFSEVRNLRKPLVGGAVTGTIIGILPGEGGAIASLLAYDVTRRWCRAFDSFGKGDVRGVVASETANNAVIGGALIPTLTMGIPGNAVTAILLGALTMHGLQPGPLLFRQTPNLPYTIFVAVIFSAFAMLVVESAGFRMFAYLLRLPKYIIYPLVIATCFLGAFALNNRIFDMWTVFIFGIVGYVMSKNNISRAPMLIGFLLGKMIERELRIALSASPVGFVELFHRPIATILLSLSIVSVIFSLISKRKEAR